MVLPIFQYQDVGAQFMATRHISGLHDEMGVGKTATAIRACEYIIAQRGLVIAPAMLRENWMAEYRKFSNAGYKLCKGLNIHDYYAWERGKYDIMITSYEQATKWADHITNAGFLLDFVALDEAHYLKNSGAARTKKILGPKYNGNGGITGIAKHVWHITGTLMPNDPMDAYTFLSMCDCLNGMTQNAFEKQFFYTYPTAYGKRTIPRPETLPVLRQLIENNSMRRTAPEVGIFLPPIFLTTATVDGDTQAVMDMLKQHPGMDRAILEAVEHGGLSFLDSQHIMTLRRLIGEAKALPYAEMLLEEIRGGSTKRVVMGMHVDALGMIRDYLIKHGVKCAIVNGTVTQKEADRAIYDFQNDPTLEVIVLNMVKGGLGVTLTASCEIDLFESNWSPGPNAQAIKRISRIGQLRKMRARFITLARSFDEVVSKIVAGKTAAIAQVEGTPMMGAPLDLVQSFV